MRVEHADLIALETAVCDLRNMARVTSFVVEHVLQDARDWGTKILKLPNHDAIVREAAEMLTFCVYETEDKANEVLDRFYATGEKKGRVGEV